MKQDYAHDISEIRAMMERSSKFLSLSGLAGTMAGIYALVGAYIAFRLLGFKPDQIHYRPPSGMSDLIILALVMLVLAIGTAIVLSGRKAGRRQEKVWNAVSRRLLAGMAVPLVSGGLLILIFLMQDLVGLILPLTLVFYGIALYNAGTFSYGEVRSMGLIQVALGIVSAWLVGYSLVLWALGFGLVHIVYGIYMHFKYER